MEARGRRNCALVRRLRARCQNNGRGTKKRYFQRQNVFGSKRRSREDSGPRRATEKKNCQAAKTAAEREHGIVDAELLWQVEQDKKAMLRCCKKAYKRRAFPPWGIPTEVTRMPLRPAVKLDDPDELAERREQRAVQLARNKKNE